MLTLAQSGILDSIATAVSNTATPEARIEGQLIARNIAKLRDDLLDDAILTYVQQLNRRTEVSVANRKKTT